MKLGIRNLYRACYDALELLLLTRSTQAVAYNGFAWYSGEVEGVTEANTAIATVRDVGGCPTLHVSNLLSTPEAAEIVTQFKNAAHALKTGLNVANT